MRTSIRVSVVPATLAGAIWLTAQAPPVAAQETGAAITGTVIDATTERPLPSVQVLVLGTRYGALTDAAGRYRIPNPPLGNLRVQARFIGYGAQVREVTLRPDQSVTLDFRLQQSAVTLSEVVVTGTGGAVEERKLGNTVARVDVTQLELAPIQSTSEVLQGRIPGVVALPSGGLSGEGARIRIRGNASLSQSNEAIVYIDGIRADNGGGFGDNVGVNGGSPSRLDDIDPESIERVEILKGAAAATLFGTEASNGVIQYFTKRGQAGPPRWAFHLQQSAVQMPDRFHPNAGFARTQAQADVMSAFYGRTIRPFEVVETKFPLQLRETGYNTSLSASVNGGSPQITYFVAGRYFDEDGPFESTRAGRNLIQPPLARDENRLYQATANVSIFPREDLRLTVRAMYADRHQEVPGNNNYIYAPFTLAQFGKPETVNCAASMVDQDPDRAGVQDPTFGIAAPGRCRGPGNQMGNTAFSTVREGLQERYFQDASHFNGVVSSSYSLTPDLTLDGTFGIDNTQTKSVNFLPFGNAVDQFSAADPDGYRAIDNTNVQNITLDSKATWNSSFTPSISSSFVFGGQGFITRRIVSGGSSHIFPGPGLEVVGAGVDPTVQERFVKVVNAGLFAQEQVGWRDWVFATVGARYDKNSAFGERTAGQLYPKASLSVVPSARSSWASNLFSTVRIRAAYGQSGRQPGAFDKFTTYEALPSEFGGGLVPSNLGNPDLKPEVSTEIEAGAELGMFSDRAQFQITYWDRTVNDALVNKQFPITGGFIARQIANIGRLEAHGWELSVPRYLMNRPSFSVDVFANGAYLKQKVASMGGAAPIKVGDSYPRYRNFLIEGYEPGALLGAKLLSACSAYRNPATQALGGCLQPGQLPYDLNGDRTPDTEAQVMAFLSDTANFTRFTTVAAGQRVIALNPLRADDDGDGDFLDHYLGKPFPDWQGGFGGNVRFLRNFRLYSLFEYKAGNYTVTNLTDAFRQANAVIGRNIRQAAEVEAAIIDPTASPERKLQAAKDWLGLMALSPYDGLNQNSPGDFVRWRELSLTYSASPRIAGVLRARDASLTLGVRNLALWTKYDGADPEINAIGRQSAEAGGDNDYLDAVDAFGFPLTRRFTLSVRLGY